MVTVMMWCNCLRNTVESKHSETRWTKIIHTYGIIKDYINFALRTWQNCGFTQQICHSLNAGVLRLLPPIPSPGQFHLAKSQIEQFSLYSYHGLLSLFLLKLTIPLLKLLDPSFLLFLLTLLWFMRQASKPWKKLGRQKKERKADRSRAKSYFEHCLINEMA